MSLFRPTKTLSNFFRYVSAKFPVAGSSNAIANWQVMMQLDNIKDLLRDMVNEKRAEKRRFPYY